MAHELEITKNGAAMAYTGETPWHNLGRKVDHAMTAAEAIVAAQMDWEVGLRPVYSPVAHETGLITYQAIPGKKSVVRNNDQKALGVVGNKYMPLQNREAFSFFDAVVGEKLAMYHTVGSLFGGRKIWLLAKVPREFFVKGLEQEKIDEYMLLQNSHDGSSAVKILLTSVRVVCNNTLTQAISDGSGMYKLRHTSSIGDKVSAVRDAMGIVDYKFKLFEDLSNRLANAPINSAKVDEFFEKMGLKVMPGDSDVARSRTTTQRLSILEKIENGKGNTHPAIKGTAWALLNGYTEYVDHVRKIKGKDDVADRRMDSVLFGTGSEQKRKAMDVALSLI